MIEHAAFETSKHFLLAIDSDGCVFNTMEIKHRACFLKEIIAIWELQAIEPQVKAQWLKINLYSKYRGINRFKGLAMLFQKIGANSTQVNLKDMEVFLKWTITADTLSAEALEKEYEKNQDPFMAQVIRWSQAVNKTIKEEVKDIESFEVAKEAIKIAKQYADVVVVSSANAKALEKEWGYAGLLQDIALLAGQEMGTKSKCLNYLKQFYKAGNIMMIGDALGDYEAAQENNIHFFPIVCGEEENSWGVFKQEIMAQFIEGRYSKETEKRYLAKMNEVLS